MDLRHRKASQAIVEKRLYRAEVNRGRSEAER
jgi:hypothetical protein